MRNRELLLAAPLGLGAVILVVVGALDPERARQGEGSLADAAAARSVRGLDGGVPAESGFEGGADSVAAADSSAPPSAEESEEAARRRSSGVADVAGPGGRGGPTQRGSSALLGVGGSHLYDGARKRWRVPQNLDGVAEVDSKARQLERSNDVAGKRGTVVGQIVTVDATSVTGWAYDWNDLETVASVDVFIDNKLFATVPANAQRPQFDPQNPSNPINSRAWTCQAPTVLGDGDKHWVTALGYRPGSDSKRELERSPWTFGGAHWPKGEIVWVSERMVYGWARDPDAPEKPLTVSVHADGKLVGTATTLGAGHNDEVFAQARALSPSKKSVIQLTGLAGPSDPNLANAIAAKLNELKVANHYFDFAPLAAAGDALPFDVFEFSLAAADGSVVALPGQERAGFKFYRVPEGQQPFLFAAPEPIVGTWVQVKLKSADGTIEREARRSPMQIAADPNRPPEGAILLVTGDHLAGYALDADALPGPIFVDVAIDGVLVARVAANETFPPAYNFMKLPNPEHGFRYTFPEKYLDGKTHTIQIFDVNQPAGVNPEIRNSPSPFVGNRNSRPYGWLDVADVDHASGWAYDPNSGGSPISVEIWVDNVLYKTVTASLDRPDLVPLAFSEPAHGYSSDMPASLKDGKHHTIRAFALDVPDGPKQELWGSPKELNAQSPYIGVNPQDTAAGLSVAEVTSGAPASVAGVVVGDVIRSYDDQSQKVDRAAFLAWVKAKEVGEKVTFRLFRDPALPAPPPASPPPPEPSPALGPNERIVVVTVGSR